MTGSTAARASSRSFSVASWSMTMLGRMTLRKIGVTTFWSRSIDVYKRQLQSQLDLLLRDGLTDKEFKSAKAQLRGGFLLGLESSGGRMQALGRGHLLMGHVRTPEETLSRIEAVTPDAVMELARRLLGQKGSAAIVGRGAEALLARIGG